MKEVASANGVRKLQTEVTTPMQKPDGVGCTYTTEENLVTHYEFDGWLVKVAKVSTKGWNVRLYEQDNAIPSERSTFFAEEGDAHKAAKTMVEGKI